MRRSVLVLAAVLGCASSDRRGELPPDVARAIQTAASEALIPVFRPAVGAPSGDGDAARDYAAAVAGVATLPPALDADARTRLGRFGHGEPLAAEVTAALASPAPRAIVAAVVAGAGRTHVRSPFALAVSPPGAMQLVAVADVAVIAARGALDAGRAVDASALLLATLRLGQDVAVRSHLLGHTIGGTIQERAVLALLDLVAAAPLDAAALAAIVRDADRVLAGQPTVRDAVVDEARLALASAGVAAGLNLGVDGRALLPPPAPAEIDRLGGPVGHASRLRDLHAAIVRLADGPPRALEAGVRAACVAALGDGAEACADRTSVLVRLASRLARLRAAVLALRVRAHAAATGSLPANLAALGAPPPPVDPLTGGALGYVVLGGRAMVTAGAGAEAITVEVSPAPIAAPAAAQKK